MPDLRAVARTVERTGLAGGTLSRTRSYVRFTFAQMPAVAEAAATVPLELVVYGNAVEGDRTALACLMGALRKRGGGAHANHAAARVRRALAEGRAES